MNIEKTLRQQTVSAIKNLYSVENKEDEIILSPTKKEFEGDLTITCFSFTKFSKKSPDITATEIGNFLKANLNQIENFNVIKGFLNLVIADSYWINFIVRLKNFQPLPSNDKTVMIEYSSPNTNKPLHLGHIRNNVLGYSVAEILKANGYKVIKVNLINDRGIHICKSMLAWMKWGKGETPQSSGMKGDHLVGKYYVVFDKENKNQAEGLILNGMKAEDASVKTPLYQEAKELLIKWEIGDKETMKTWKMMNDWVYEGFNNTYKRMGVDFDKRYYESETYLFGKKIIEEGLTQNIFFKKEDGSVWIDLKEESLEEKCLLRSDGTSVYITQDLGTAQLKYDDYKMDKSVYVVGNEQDYHFKVLFTILKKLKKPFADGLFHLSYGMVDLPEGKMKSREGTVVDADDLIDEMVATAKKTTEELGKIEDFSEEEANNLYYHLGLGALKYFLLKVDPKKRLLFNPQESIDFHGHTGPFIQYTYARIKSILRKSNMDSNFKFQISNLACQEKELIMIIHQFPSVLKEAGEKFDPSHIANYVFYLAKNYNKFYAELSVLHAENENLKNFRLKLSEITAQTIQLSMKLLGIEVPEQM